MDEKINKLLFNLKKDIAIHHDTRNNSVIKMNSAHKRIQKFYDYLFDLERETQEHLLKELFYSECPREKIWGARFAKSLDVLVKEADDVLQKILIETKEAQSLYVSDTETEVAFVTMDGTKHMRKKILNHDLAEKYSSLNSAAFDVMMHQWFYKDGEQCKMVTKKHNKDLYKKD